MTKNKNKTHCVRGHEFTVDNIYVNPSRPSVRICKACREWHRENRKPFRAVSVVKGEAISALVALGWTRSKLVVAFGAVPVRIWEESK